MKWLTFLGVLILLFGCTHNHSVVKPFPGDIALTTDKTTYHPDETILLKLRNNSGAGIIVGYRCGRMLELSYQQKEQGKWHNILDVDYPMCPTTMREVARGTVVSDSLPASSLRAKGVFRLVLGFNPLHQADVTDQIYSNEFKIE